MIHDRLATGGRGVPFQTANLFSVNAFDVFPRFSFFLFGEGTVIFPSFSIFWLENDTMTHTTRAYAKKKNIRRFISFGEVQ
jgi:hypothetical protein